MRAQATLEFLVLAAVLFVLFLALLETYAERLHAGEDFQQRLSARRVSDDVARHVNRALQSGNASRVQFRLPSQLPGGENYTLAVFGRRLELAWGSDSVSSLLLTTNLSASFSPGVLHNATNVNGGIVVGPA